MQKAGVGILAGTDTANPYCFPGFSLHDELGFLVQAGLSPLQALQAATLNPARYFGKEKDFGTVEAGKIADLVLLDADPLNNIGNTQKIDAVFFDGREFDRSGLVAMLQNVEALASLREMLLNTTREKGADAAVAQYRELRAAHTDAYDSSEDELNGLGYQLIRMKRLPDAIKIFKLNVEAYPQSYNAYDSLGEAYMDNGDRQLAIQNYEKSLQLNPKNENAVRMLKKLKGQSPG